MNEWVGSDCFLEGCLYSLEYFIGRQTIGGSEQKRRNATRLKWREPPFAVEQLELFIFLFAAGEN